MKNLVLIGLFATMAAGADLKVLYTGKLIGYGRACFIEEYAPAKEARFYNRRCATPRNAYSDAMGALLKAEKTSGALVLGAGDHFSLDFGARNAILNPDEPGKRRIVGREEMFYIEGKGWFWLNDPDQSNPAPYQGAPDTRVNGDAVAEFLADSGYDAIVPGKHDFYLGPERVRQIARYMAEKNMRMLGANLVIRGQRLKPPAVLPAGSPHRGTNFEADHPKLKIKLPGFVLPWMRRIRVENAMSNGQQQFERAKICESKDVDHQTCGAGGLELEPRGNGDYFIPGVEQLKTGLAYHVCLINPAGGKPGRPFCKAFEVERSFYDYGLAPSPPYLVRGNAVVFGVAAPGLEKQIGKMNSQWIDPAGQFEIQAVALDPIEALRQALDYCDAAGACPAGKPKILLAPMPAAAAQTIDDKLQSSVRARMAYQAYKNRQPAQTPNQAIGTLELAPPGLTTPAFSLIIAEADAVHFTPFDKVTYPLNHPPLTVAPKPPYEGNGKMIELGVHVQSVTFTKDGVITGATSHGKAPVATTDFHTDMGKLVSTALQAEGLWSAAGDAAADFRDLTLAVMRRKTKASAALIQKRDLFEASLRQSRAIDLGKDTPLEDQILAAVDGILWKGDFLVHRYIKGSALKKVMAQSETFDKLDEDPYERAEESQRGLAALGIVKDPAAKSWVIDGAPVEDDKMYLIATTDFLAFGDTGYPELNQPAVGNPQRAGEMKGTKEIAGLVYEALTSSGSFKAAPASTSATKHSAGCPRGEIIDCLKWDPAPEPPVASLGQQFEGYFKSPPAPTLQGLLAGPGISKDNQTLTQLRPIWKLAVEKANIGINRYRNNQGKQSVLSSRFVGVPESGVSAPNSKTLSWDWAAELRRERFRSMDFARLEGSFAQTDAQQKDDSYLKAYASNTATSEAGWRRAFGQTVRQRPWTGVLLSGVFGTQQFNPRSLATAYYTPPTESSAVGFGCAADSKGRCGESYYAFLGRTTRAALKAGIRHEFRDTWFEGGLFGGTVHRPVSYKLAGAANCDLRTATLSGCLGSSALLLDKPFQGTPAQSSTSAFGPESGVFFNFNWNMPVHPKSKMKIEFTNRGRYYFNHSGDTRFDTRLSNLFTAAFSAPIAGGLTFKPTWTLFHYENKPNTLSRTADDSNLLVGNTLDLKLNYSFDWRSGQSWRKALRYGNGK